MPLKFAIIGPGKIARNSLLPALKAQSGACLWSVLSRDRERAAEVAREFGARAPQPAFDDLNALLADPELDAVILASPDRLHAPQVIAAARAGKHCFTEKPMATENSEATAMVEACAEAGVRLGVAYHLRWHAGHRKLHNLVADGEIGDLRHMRLMWSRQHPNADNWRATPEVGRWWSLAGVGTHCLDQVRWFMAPGCGEIVKVVSVINHAVWGSPHDETAVLALQFENGSTAEICTSVLFDAPRRMEIYGSEGFALCENTLGADGSGSITTHHGNLEFEAVDPYRGELADFVAAIRDQRDPEVPGSEGARNVALLLEAIGEG